MGILSKKLAERCAGSLAMTVAGDVFADELPADPDLCVALLETTGGPDIHNLGGVQPGAHIATVRLLVRGTSGSFTSANDLAWRAYRALWDVEEIASTGAGDPAVLMVSSQYPPVKVEKDDRDRYVMAVGFTVHWQAPAS